MKATGATKEATTKFTFEVVTGRHKIYRGLDQIATADDGESAQLIIDALNERERLREALRATINSLVRTVHKTYPGYPEEQMQISPAMTVADARVILNDATPRHQRGWWVRVDGG